MTDTELVDTIRDLIAASRNSAPIFKPPVQPDPPAPPQPLPPSTDVDGAFTWGEVGEVKHLSFMATRIYCYSNDVPAGYTGTFSANICPDGGTVPYVPELHIWVSDSPRGPAIKGCEYRGAWQTGMPMWTPEITPDAGPIYYNVMLSVDSNACIRQAHQ